MFLNNKYTKWYFQLIENTSKRYFVKKPGDGFDSHHIIPSSLGGCDDWSNRVYLSYREHKLAHLLLTKMTTGQEMWKMKHAYKLFDKEHDLTGTIFGWTEESHKKSVKTRKRNGSYKTGKENVFAKPEIIEIVKVRMKKDNPMKRPEQIERMKLKNHRNRPITFRGQEFISMSSAARHFSMTIYEIRKEGFD